VAHDPSCIFCRIVAGEIPSRKVVEDDEMLVFHDIAPWAPVHVLMIPFGRMVALAPELMRQLGVTNGFRTLINTGQDGMQEVQHVHMHVMGGPRPWLKG